MENLPRRALSIRQPWAWLIIHAGKDIENRSWSTSFRGPVCLHAAKGMTRDEYEDALSTAHTVGLTHPIPLELTMPAKDDLERGGIVGVANLTGCLGYSESPWFFGRFGFVLEDVRPVPFLPVKGKLGFFDWRAQMDTSHGGGSGDAGEARNGGA